MPRKRAAQLDREIAEALARPKQHLEYRSIGSDGEPWPEWLTATKNSCGVYVIRDLDGEPLYAGSSHKNLYGTVSRHFQNWRRSKKFWKGYKTSGEHSRATDHDPGMTYHRGKCEVGIRVMACGGELDEEASLIHRLSPRDNLVANPEGEVPF